jgi:hypothetical protein
MRSWVLAACLLAAAVAPPALAADMDDGTWHPNGGLYDDDDDLRYPHEAPPHYNDDDDDDDGLRPPKKYSDDNGRPPPKKHADVPPPHDGKCVRSEHVRERLTGMGWHDFHAGQPVSETEVTLRARLRSGRLFELTLHRCSGLIVDARALEPRRNGPYAFKGPVEEPHGPWGRRPYGYDRPWFERPYAYRWPRRWDRD